MITQPSLDSFSKKKPVDKENIDQYVKSLNKFELIEEGRRLGVEKIVVDNYEKGHKTKKWVKGKLVVNTIRRGDPFYKILIQKSIRLKLKGLATDLPKENR